MKCPNPDKVPFATLRGAAESALDNLEFEGRAPQRPYECDCGRYHLTTRGLNGNLITADMVRFLADSVGLTNRRSA